MTQEEKRLLIKDITARLSYGLKVQIDFGEHCIKYGINRYVDDTVICAWPETFEIGVNDEDQACDIEDVKPYLRPMSSMTDEERMEFTKLFDKWHDDELFDYIEEGVEFSIWKHKGISASIFDWFNKNMFDYRGLITMGLALEATKDMYNTQTE